MKELTTIGRAKKEPIEIINLNLDSPVSTEIAKFWAFSVRKEQLQILSRNYLLIKGKEEGKRIWYLRVSNRSKWWLQCTEADKWRDYCERRSKLHRRGDILSNRCTHCQCCTQRLEAISSSIEWQRCCYVHFRVFSCVQNNKCQQNLSGIWNSWTPETYTSLPVSSDLRNRKIANAA